LTTKGFGEYIKKLRLEAGFETMEALARASGVSAPTIMRLESGKTKDPSIDTLKRLAGPLHIPHKELMEAAGYFSTPNADTCKDERAEYSVNPTKEAVFNLLSNPVELAKLERPTLIKLQTYISAVLDFANGADLAPEELKKIQELKKILFSQRNKGG